MGASAVTLGQYYINKAEDEIKKQELLIEAILAKRNRAMSTSREPLEESSDIVVTNNSIDGMNCHRFYNELSIIEDSIVEEYLPKLNATSKDLILFLEECDEEIGFNIQNLLTTMMAARNAYLGYNSEFPEFFCPYIIQNVFDQIQKEIPLASKTRSQKDLADSAFTKFMQVLSEEMLIGTVEKSYELKAEM